jgi:hypothetical protein
MSRRGRWLGAACLVLFPLLFIVFAGTGIHPGPSGTTQEQIRLVAAAEGRWRLVHLVLAAASLLGIGAVITLWMIAVRGRSGVLAWVGDLGLVFGVAGAALLSGVVLMEAGLVAPLAVACAQSPACLAPEGAGAADAIARLGCSRPLSRAVRAGGVRKPGPPVAHRRGGRCGSVTGRAGRPRRSGGPWLEPGERGTAGPAVGFVWRRLDLQSHRAGSAVQRMPEFVGVKVAA